MSLMHTRVKAPTFCVCGSSRFSAFTACHRLCSRQSATWHSRLQYLAGLARCSSTQTRLRAARRRAREEQVRTTDQNALDAGAILRHDAHLEPLAVGVEAIDDAKLAVQLRAALQANELD
eukprot:2749178-Prymnesium_polylepis.3